MSHHLAQIDIGRMLHPIDHPGMAEFVAQLDRTNALADAAPGFSQAFPRTTFPRTTKPSSCPSG